MALGTFRATPSVYIRAAGGVVATATAVADVAGCAQTPLRADARPVALRAQVAQAAPQVSRMASRFSQLAVLGAAACLARARGAVDADARVYLATGLGDVAHTDALYFGVMPPRSEMPPPARFATSGNNMAAFFVAQHAGLAGRNLTLSETELSLECALELALSDIAAGATRSALLGGVDETTLPRDFYTRRFQVGPDQYIGEGSGWLLLDAFADHDEGHAVGAILGAWVMPASCPTNPDSLIDHVRWASQAFRGDALQSSRLIVLRGTGIAETESVGMDHAPAAHTPDSVCREYLAWTGRFPTAAAVGIAAMFGANHEQRRDNLNCLHVNRDTRGRTGMIAFEVYRG